MFGNYIKVAFRNLIRNKGYSVISISGLAVGIAVFVLITLYLQYETSFDEFHENADGIFRIEELWKTSRGYGSLPLTPAPLGDALKRTYPEIKDFARVIKMGPNLLSTVDGGKKILQKEGLYADNSFFDIFTVPLVAGDPGTVLSEPYSMVVTAELAQKFFPGQESLGQRIRIKDHFDCRVTGVVQKLPDNTHLSFSYLISMPSYKEITDPGVLEEWDDDFVYSYLLLRKEQSPGRLGEKISGFIMKRRTEAAEVNLYLRPLTDIHLFSNTNYELKPSTPFEIILLFAGIGIFILLVACINFMNLSTAYSTVRAKEVGIRKTLGAGRFSLIKQFLVESIVLSIICSLIALLMVKLYIPEFNSLLNTHLQISFVRQRGLLIELCLIALAVGIVSGSYPAFFLSSFKPAVVLKGPARSGARAAVLRKIFVAAQFLITVVFVVVSFVIYRQGNFLKSMDKGFDEDNILIQRFAAFKGDGHETLRSFKNELLGSPLIQKAAVSADLPYAIYNDMKADWEGGEEDETVWVTYTYVDPGFIDTYGLTLLKGRNFPRQVDSDRESSCLINEAAAGKFGWDSSQAIGKRIVDKKYTVIGVVKDFHSSDLRLGIKPLIMFPFVNDGKTGFYFSVKFESGSLNRVTGYLEDKFDKFFPDELYEFRTLKWQLDETFVSYDNWVKLLIYFSVLSILIASFGLYAISSYTARQRTKEIGIRKVLGAAVPGILGLLLKEFLKILIAANLIGLSIAFFMGSAFLQNFIYRFHLNAWIFLAASIMMIGLSVATIGYQIVKAALANPVDSLRYE